jgi:hypothetical protein
MKWREVEELDLSTIHPKSTAAIVRGDGATGRHFPSPFAGMQLEPETLTRGDSVRGRNYEKKIIVIQVTFREHLGIINNSVIRPWITQ